jgi:hypothetical protein
LRIANEVVLLASVVLDGKLASKPRQQLSLLLAHALDPSRPRAALQVGE